MGEAYLADTNVVSKYFEEQLPEWALTLLDDGINRQSVYLSVITRIELKVHKPLIARREQQIQDFIDASIVLDLSEEIILRTIRPRRQDRIKLPDAIIAATAIVNGFTLLSTNDSDFQRMADLTYQSLN